MICQGALSPAQLHITSSDPLGDTVGKYPDPPHPRLRDIRGCAHASKSGGKIYT